jgi:hypothetical protein
MPGGERIFSILWHNYFIIMSTLNIQVVPTYNTLTISIQDISTYDVTPTSPTIRIVAPGVDVSIPFVPNTINTFNSTSLGLTTLGNETSLPDGVYYLTYSIAPALSNYVNRTFMRTDLIQEKFDNAFMKLDMMECDKAIKTQSKVDLTTINFFIQGSIAAANNSAIDVANKLYIQANKQLDNFIKNNCGCTGTNYVVNYTAY